MEIDLNQNLPKYVKTIKIDAKTWNLLKNIKKENETFDEVIIGLLNQRTKFVGNEELGMIKYARKTDFMQTSVSRYSPIIISYSSFRKTEDDIKLGIEFEYNDIKNTAKFTIDLKINKIYYGKKSYNPSFFFGLDNNHKHLSSAFLKIYLECILNILKKEYRVNIAGTGTFDFDNILNWKKLYYDFNLSEDSFSRDIEEPLRLSVDEKISDIHKKKINESVHANIDKY